MATARPISDPRPDDGVIIRNTFTKFATQLGYVPTLRQFEELSNIPRTTASRYVNTSFRQWLMKANPKLIDRRGLHKARKP